MPAFSHRGLAKKGPFLVSRSDEVTAEEHGTGLGSLSRKPPKSEGIVLSDGIASSVDDVPIEEIYRAPEAGTFEFTTALALLRESIESCNHALAALARSQDLQADDDMVHVQVKMPELFCCRAVGDGFAEVVNAVQSSFENLGGRPMDPAQVEVVRNAFLALRSEPRMSFDRSMTLVDAMEKVGLIVDPALVEGLEDWLDE